MPVRAITPAVEPNTGLRFYRDADHCDADRDERQGRIFGEPLAFPAHEPSANGRPGAVAAPEHPHTDEPSSSPSGKRSGTHSQTNEAPGSVNPSAS